MLKISVELLEVVNTNNIDVTDLVNELNKCDDEYDYEIVTDEEVTDEEWKSLESLYDFIYTLRKENNTMKETRMDKYEVLQALGIADIAAFEAMSIEEKRSYLEGLLGTKVVLKSEMSEEEYNNVPAIEDIILEAKKEMAQKQFEYEKAYDRAAKKVKYTILGSRITAALLTGGISEIVYQLAVEPKLKENLPSEFIW